MTGRPTKLTEKCRETIVAAVRHGHRYGRAASQAKIARSTLQEWLRRGARALEVSETTGEAIPKEERRFAELYINFDGGPLEESDYFGIYAITETIKNQDDRVDINNLKLDENTEPGISGGYIFKFDQAALDDNEPVIECTGSGLLQRPGGGFGGPMPVEGDAGSTEPGHCFQYLGIVDPPEVSPEQLTWIAVEGSDLAFRTWVR